MKEIISNPRKCAQARNCDSDIVEDNTQYYNSNPLEDYAKFLSSVFWRDVKIRAKGAYGTSCECCDSNENIHVHHVTYCRVEESPLENLVILCEECHTTTHKINGTTPNQNREQCIIELKEYFDPSIKARRNIAERRERVKAKREQDACRRKEQRKMEREYRKAKRAFRRMFF